MAGVMDSVNQRTQLVGQNRLELLLFRLSSQQLYGINVFKVKEVLQCPPLNAIPGRNAVHPSPTVALQCKGSFPRGRGRNQTNSSHRFVVWLPPVSAQAVS